MIALRVSDFTQVVTGGTPSTAKKEFWEGGIIPWLNSGELNQDIITVCSNFITEHGLKNSNAKMMPSDTVLVALTGTTTGKVGYLTFDACANQSVSGILPSKEHHPKYLYYFLLSQRSKIIGDSYGGAQKHISQSYIQNIRVPLPPLPIQKKIAAILDKSDSLRQKDKQLLEYYNQLSQSIFYDMFGDPVRNEKGWEIMSIRDIVEDVKYGTSKPAEEVGKYPYLRMNNITYLGEWNFSDLKYINLTEGELNKYLLKRGDLVFNRTNSKELVGKTAVYKSDEEMAIAGYLIRVRTNEKAVTDYISAFLNSSHGKAILRGMCKNIIGMANINAQELQNIQLPIPPVQLQVKFKQKIEMIVDQKKYVIKQLENSDLLFQSLLQKAFNGELVKEP